MGSIAGGRFGSVGVAMVPRRAAATRNGFCTGLAAVTAGGGSGRDAGGLESGAEQKGMTGSVTRTGLVSPPGVGAVIADSVDQWRGAEPLDCTVGPTARTGAGAGPLVGRTGPGTGPVLRFSPPPNTDAGDMSAGAGGTAFPDSVCPKTPPKAAAGFIAATTGGRTFPRNDAVAAVAGTESRPALQRQRVWQYMQW